MNEHVSCQNCGVVSPIGTLICQNCNSPIAQSPEDSMKTQAITGIDELLRQDRHRREAEAEEEVYDESEDHADPTEAIDFSDLLAAGILDNQDSTEAIDFSSMLPTKEPEPELEEEEDEAEGHDPTQAMDFRSFEAALASQKPAPPPEPPPVAGPGATEAMDYDSFAAQLRANKGPNIVAEPEAPAPPPTPAPPVQQPPRPAAPPPRESEPTAAISYEPAPPAPAPPRNLAPPPSAPPASPPARGGGRGAAPEPEKSKTGLYTGIGIAAFVILCCCPSSIFSYLHWSGSPLVSGIFPTSESGATDEGADPSGGEGEGEGGSGGEGGGDGIDLSKDTVKKVIEEAEYEIIGDPTETNNAGFKVIAFSVKKDALAGTVTLTTYADEESAGQTMAAYDISEDTSARRAGLVVVAVTFVGHKDAATELVKAIAE